MLAFQAVGVLIGTDTARRGASAGLRSLDADHEV